MGKRFIRTVFLISVALLLCEISIICKYSGAAIGKGRVVTIDGINFLSTFTFSITGDYTTGYIYDAIKKSDKSLTITETIGYIQPFYWANDANYTHDAVTSLTSILRSAYAETKSRGGPLVIVSHSWGTVLAYIVLEQNPDIVVDKLITMGSPLSIVPMGTVDTHDLIGAFTILKLAQEGIAFINALSNIKTWYNYWASCDPVSEIIPAVDENNINATTSILINDPLSILFCHSGYFEDPSTWNEILANILNTQPSLSIAHSPYTISAPSDVNFNATGSLANDSRASYSWDFGDGYPDTGKSVTHFYRNPGNYNVTLTMTDSSGGTHKLSESITVLPPKIDVSYPDGYESLKRHFSTPSNSYAKEYAWQYGDSSSAETGQSHNHTFPSSGNYYVTLTLTLNDGSTISATEPIFVGPGTRYIYGHTVYYDETWYSGGTYVVQGSMSIAEGGKLTIESGARVELSSGSTFYVSGTLIATGVKFTAQDQAGSGWAGITFDGAGSKDSRLENCVLEWVSYFYGYYGVIYVKDSSPTIKGCTIDKCSTYYGIFIINGSPVIQGNTINGFKEYGIYVDGTSSPAVTGNTITNNQYGIYVSYSANNPIFSGNTYSDNAKGDLTVEGTIQGAVSWDETSDAVYNIKQLNIPQGSSLTIASGRTLKINPGISIPVSGTLKATGVKFTAQDQAGSGWAGITFYGAGSKDSRLENCVLECVPYYYGYYGVIYVNDSSPTIKGVYDR